MITWFLLLGCNLLIPTVMLIGGRIFMKRAPRRINSFIGYRTTMSMKNQDTWQFAHKVSGRFMFRWGWVAIGVGVVPMAFVWRRSENAISIVGLVAMCAQLIILLAAILHTEKALKSQFDKMGNRLEKE